MSVTAIKPQSLLIPRAEEEIARTIAEMRTVRFSQDSLMSMEESFLISIWDSAKKRDGRVIEAAVMDAIDQTPTLRLLPVVRVSKRKVDVQFEVLANGHVVVLEMKRGAHHDSTKIRGFRADLIKIPEIIQQSLPLCLAGQIHFHIVFVSGKPPIPEGLAVANLKKLYGLDASLHLDTACRRFSREVRSVIEERTR